MLSSPAHYFRTPIPPLFFFNTLIYVTLYAGLQNLTENSREMKLQRNLRVWKMGMVNYAAALELQECLASDRKMGKISDTVLSLQHPPTYTLGKRRTDHNLLLPESDLKSHGR